MDFMDRDELTVALYQAAENRQTCRISLTGEPFPRVIHPYGIARTARNQIVLICWQSMGITKAGAGEGYRNLKLDRIIEMEVLETEFQKRDDFNPFDAQYAEWVFHI
jgi:predicted DNA-binding transcriptional regulator YafY